MKEIGIKKFAVMAQDYFLKLTKTIFDQRDTEKIAFWIKKAFSAVSPTVLSFIISQKALPLSTYPLGIALIAAARGDTVFFFIGTMIFAILNEHIPLMMGALSLIVLRFVFSKIFEDTKPISYKSRLKEKIFNKSRPFCESEALKSSTAALAAFTMGCMQIITGGFSIGDLFGTCICIAVSPILCYLYSGYFTAVEKHGVRYEAGLIALLSTLIFAISDTEPLGISFFVIVASFISFILAKRKNPYSACLFALVAVLAAEPILSPAFAVSAAVASFLYHYSKLYAVCLGAIFFAGISYLTGGITSFAFYFPEFMLGAVLSVPIKDEAAERFLPFVNNDSSKKISTENEILGYKQKRSAESIQDISKSFEALSKVFFDLSDKNTRIGIFDTRHICDSVCDRYCKKCDMVSICWERDYGVTLDALNRISAKIYKTGRVEKKDLPSEFTMRCNNTDKLLSDIENENRRVIKGMLREDKTRAFAVDYAVFARVLSEALEKNEAEYAPNHKVREALINSLSKIGFYADSIGVYGNRCKSIHAFRIGKGAVKCKAEDIKKAVSDGIGSRVDDPVFEFADGGINMICKQAEKFNAGYSCFSCAAEKENGDRVCAFDVKNGYFYALVNDGMGSGRAAAKKSAAASVFLEKMLRAGNSAASGIEMLSALARADGEEGFTTLDLFELDKISGKASFIKSGAAPSFVKRGNKLFKIKSKTFPLGILEDVDAERTTFECENGDFIIILSDGVTEDIEEPLWLCEFLTKTDLSVENAAQMIVDEAKAHTLCRDDMTAAVIVIKDIV